MKLSDEALLKIVDIFRQGILGMKDVSQELRDIRFVERDGALYPVSNIEPSRFVPPATAVTG